MRIVFERHQRYGMLARLFRVDGVVVELPSYSRAHRVPHDLAHVVAEREFELAGGVFGTVAAGGLFANARVVAGRPRHDAAARSRRVLRANAREITLAEVMAGALHAVVERNAATASIGAFRHDWGIVRADPFPYSQERIDAATGILRELVGRWGALADGGGLGFHWPDRLIRPVPAETGRTRRAA